MMPIGYVSIKIKPISNSKYSCILHDILARNKINAKFTFYGSKKRSSNNNNSNNHQNASKIVFILVFVFAFVEIKYIINHKLHLQGLSSN